MKAGVKLFPLNSWPAFQMFSSTLGARFCRPLARYLQGCLGLQPLSSAWRGAVEWVRHEAARAESALCHSILSARPPCPSQQEAGKLSALELLGSCPAAAPGSSHPPHPSPALPSSCLHEGSGRINFFFLVFNTLTFDSAVERSLGTDCQGVFACENRDSNKAFGKWGDLRHLNHPRPVLSEVGLGLPCAQGVEHLK